MTGISLLNQLSINCWVPMMRSELFIHTSTLGVLLEQVRLRIFIVSQLHAPWQPNQPVDLRFPTALWNQTEYDLDEKQDDRCGYFSPIKVPGTGAFPGGDEIVLYPGGRFCSSKIIPQIISHGFSSSYRSGSKATSPVILWLQFLSPLPS